MQLFNHAVVKDLQARENQMNDGHFIEVEKLDQLRRVLAEQQKRLLLERRKTEELVLSY